MLYQRDPAIVRRKIGTETVLVPVRNSTDTMHHIFSLNETGAFVWEHLHIPISAEQLTTLLISEYEVEIAQAQADINTILERLKDAELIQEVSDGF